MPHLLTLFLKRAGLGAGKLSGQSVEHAFGHYLVHTKIPGPLPYPLKSACCGPRLISQGMTVQKRCACDK